MNIGKRKYQTSQHTKSFQNQQAKTPGEILYNDISSMIHPSAGGKKHWLLIVDEATEYTHSFFIKKKSDLVETKIIWIKTLFMKYHIRIKKIRLDYSGENRMLHAKSNKQYLGIKLEFTAPGTHEKSSNRKKIPNIDEESKGNDDTCWF